MYIVICKNHNLLMWNFSSWMLLYAFIKLGCFLIIEVFQHHLPLIVLYNITVNSQYLHSSELTRWVPCFKRVWRVKDYPQVVFINTLYWCFNRTHILVWNNPVCIFPFFHCSVSIWVCTLKTSSCHVVTAFPLTSLQK